MTVLTRALEYVKQKLITELPYFACFGGQASIREKNHGT